MSGKDNNNPIFGVLKAILYDEGHKEAGALWPDSGSIGGFTQEDR
jgi:hypothetical protein